jgi:hypothetical protein
VIDAFIAVVWIVYLSDLFVAAVPGAWTFRGRPGAMRASVGPDIQLAGGFALMRLPVLPFDAAFVALGEDLPAAPRTTCVDAVLAEVRPVAAVTTVLALLLLAGLIAVRVGWLTPRAWIAGGATAWLVAVVLIVRAFRRVHRRWPSLETWLATLVSPVGASRGVYALSWRSLDALHPVEAAAVLCDDAELLRVARLWVYDAPDDRAAIERLLAPRGLARRLDDPPPPDADRLPRYCPRCGSGYAAFAEACADCRVPLADR